MKRRKKSMKNYEFCPICKSNLSKRKQGSRTRLICRKCGWVHYNNPLSSVVAFVCNSADKVLLVKRGVTPGRDKWALPSGFIEQTETPQDAVLRELKEETNIKGAIKDLIGAYTEPTLTFILIAYNIEFISGRLKHGSDAQGAGFFPAKKLPTIAFRSHKAIIKDGLIKTRCKNTFIEVLKSKITMATITHTQLYYRGSMGIDSTIIKAANLIAGEKVHVLNYNNGERLETYIIEEKTDSGKMVLYGPASKKGNVGDKLCILSYALVDSKEAKKMKPKILILDKRNRIKRRHT